MIQSFKKRIKPLIKKWFTIDFYLAVLEGRQKVRIFLILFIITVIMSAGTFITMFLPAYPYLKGLESRTDELIGEIFRDGLVITIKNGTASTNMPEPYYLTLDQDRVEKIFGIKNKDNTLAKTRWLAIDTKGKAEDFERYQSYALLTQTNLVYYSDRKINIYPLRDIGDLTVDKKTVMDKFKEINSRYQITRIILVLAYIAPILLMLMTYIVILIIFLYIAFGVYLAARINKIGIGFRQIYRYAVVIALLPTLIWDVIALIPYIGVYTKLLDQLHTMFIFALAYYGIRQYQERNKIK